MVIANLGECIGFCRVGIDWYMAMAAFGKQGQMKFILVNSSKGINDPDRKVFTINLDTGVKRWLIFSWKNSMQAFQKLKKKLLLNLRKFC